MWMGPGLRRDEGTVPWQWAEVLFRRQNADNQI